MDGPHPPVRLLDDVGDLVGEQPQPVLARRVVGSLPEVEPGSDRERIGVHRPGNGICPSAGVDPHRGQVDVEGVLEKTSNAGVQTESAVGCLFPG
jgi:hypothetical protein